MFANLRAIWEITAAAGQTPAVEFDSDGLSPPTYTDLVQRGETAAVVAADAVDQSFAIPVDACAVLLFSDQPVTLKLAAGETELTVRSFMIGGADEGAVAFPEGELLVSGTGTPANVLVYYIATVT
jgi:hypothetical protein